MALTFPNRSRSFDEAKNGIRFVGYDGMFEVPFLVKDAVFAKMDSSKITEAECLARFDAARSSVYDVAREVYSRSRQTSYVLTTADFR